MSRKAQQRDVTEALRQLLAESKASTQDEIASTLAKQGFELSQSKISRLLHKVGAIKVNNAKGESSYRLPHEYRLSHELADPLKSSIYNQLVINIANSDVLIVIKTIPSAASMVARLLDHHAVELEILGTLAGDDTVMVVPKLSKRIPEILKAIKELLI
ncbi:MAG TPA: ArgR family transcriptional regulator [Coxiellaceae bacterium]|nr:ArgR family transcriptional regulator [Coxiellaceae bacterium]